MAVAMGEVVQGGQCGDVADQLEKVTGTTCGESPGCNGTASKKFVTGIPSTQRNCGIGWQLKSRGSGSLCSRVAEVRSRGELCPHCHPRRWSSFSVSRVSTI